MTVQELFNYVKEFKEEFHKFRDNEFTHLERRVDKISIKVAWIVGVIATLTLVTNVLLRVL